jgi:hypothetical protein
MLNNAA